MGPFDPCTVEGAVNTKIKLLALVLLVTAAFANMDDLSSGDILQLMINAHGASVPAGIKEQSKAIGEKIKLEFPEFHYVNMIGGQVSIYSDKRNWAYYGCVLPSLDNTRLEFFFTRGCPSRLVEYVKNTWTEANQRL